MPGSTSRREIMKQLGAAGAGVVLSNGILRGQDKDVLIAGKPVEVAVSSLSPASVRITVLPLEGERTVPVPADGALVSEEMGRKLAAARPPRGGMSVQAGSLRVRFSPEPPTLHVETAKGEILQRLTMDAATPTMSFLLSKGPLLGMGEGGPQFDRKGSVDRMINGQGGYRLATHGGRAPVQWLIGTDGWAMFIHQPYGAFDLSGAEGKFTPDQNSLLPLDVFVVAGDPAAIMAEYARITGYPEMPALWTFGYQQSHRTLAGPEEIFGVAKKLRENKLPCDTLIYLGTEFCPSGWNTRNGEFTWHPSNFPNPKKMIDDLHADHFHVVVHTVLEGHRLTGTISDPCTNPQPSGRTADDRWPPDRQVSCYWPVHKGILDAGVDGWWPDQGDGYDAPSRLNRHRMYWEGTLMYRPNQRPFALHRNASPGVQRYGGFLWSGDVQSRWETLKAHVAVGINSGLSGFPYWGTDIGGFIPTPEYTGELHVRWFQFGAFCPLFRAHGRHWHLRLPWGWDSGDGGPPETNWKAAPEELQNKEVEPICRKYLELRYRLLPYTYTAVKETSETGLPIMRALWLHYPADAAAVARGDEYLWGRDILVAPIFEKGATSRRLYLPRGVWFDFWSGERLGGGHEIERRVDLATLPLYVRAGAVIATGPLKQYVDEPVNGPTTLTIYPGSDGASWIYEDDGKSFEYRKGAWMKVEMLWRDAQRRLTLQLAQGSRMLPPLRREIEVRLAGSNATKPVVFTGRQLEVSL